MYASVPFTSTMHNALCDEVGVEHFTITVFTALYYEACRMQEM